MKLLSTAVSFALSIVVSRRLGSERAGIYFLSLTVITFLALVSRAGMENLLLKRVSFEYSKGNWANIQEQYNRGILICLVVGVFIAATVVILSDEISSGIFSKNEIGPVLGLMALAIVPVAVTILHGQLFRALRKMLLSSLFCELGLPLATLLLFVAFTTENTAMTPAICYTGGVLIVCIFSVAAWHVEKSGKIKDRQVATSQRFGTMARAAWAFFIISISNYLIYWFASFAVGAFAKSSDVGVYHIALRVSSLMIFMLASINAIAAPIISMLYQKNDILQLKTVIVKIVYFTIFSSTPLFVAIVLFGEEILWIFGEEFRRGYWELLILSIGYFIASATGPVGYLLLMTGNEKKLKKVVLYTLVLSVVLNCLIIPKAGILGGAIVTSLVLAGRNIACAVILKVSTGISLYRAHA